MGIALIGILLLLLAIIGGITLYNSRVIGTLLKEKGKKWFKILIIVLNVHLIPLLGIIFLVNRSMPETAFSIAKIAIIEILLLWTTQLLLFILFIAQDLLRFVKRFVKKGAIAHRSPRFIKGSLLSAFALFCFLLYHLTSPLRHFEVTRVDSGSAVKNGLTMLQLSDLHVGGLAKSDYKGLEKMVELCNAENPDILVITGDIISNYPNELDGYQTIFESLKARQGKYFIFGNHDIGMYNRWDSDQQRLESIADLKQRVQKMGYTVLQDSVAQITTGIDTIYLMGVDESDMSTYTNRYLNLYNTIPDNRKIISLSHNPHYFDIISFANPQPKVFLTLAGHTHTMQIELTIPLWGKWSPSKWIHKFSSGAYQVGTMKLYVNKGIGHHVYRRIGATPEITVYSL